MPSKPHLGVRVLATLGALAATFGLLPAADASPGQQEGELRIEVLSSRADLISGGDALVDIELPAGADPARVRVSVDGRDVTDFFAVRPNGRFQGLLEGLEFGENVVSARLPGHRPAQLTVTNHLNGGPVLSGPQIQPWVCQSTAVDEQCNQDPEFEFWYRSTNPLTPGWQPYDPDDPPSDVAVTTTDEDVEVPFVVRVETGYQNRDQYKIATLFQPGEDWEPWAPQRQWNHKVLMTHGGGCGASYGAGTAPDVLNDSISTGISEVDDLAGTNAVPTALGRGFAVVSTALNNTGHNCNIVTEAESMMMVKERVVEQYGPVRYTIGVGCSGGAVAQQQVSNAYPGIYQGLVVACSYPDIFSPGAQFADYHLLRLYFEDPSKWDFGVVWLPGQMAAVYGHLSPVNAVVADEALFKVAVDPTTECPGVSDEERYHPDDNPGGVRCSILDYMINVLGPRQEADWSDVERQLGRGFAGAPLGNTGIQFGLEALRRGAITPAQFVDLNTKVGGLDIDLNPVPERVPANRPAMGNAYRSGAINDASNLDQVAIIDHGGPDPGAAHDAMWAWVTRERIEQQHGHFGNHVIWFGHVPLIGDPAYAREAVLAIDRWLTAVEGDDSDRPLADKIVANRPDDIEDRCSQVPGVELIDLPGVGRVCELPEVQTRLSTPRMVAGDHFTSDTHQCQLRPMRRGDYFPILFNNRQWERLQQAFPNGVCDYGRPPSDQAPTVPWLTYADEDGNVVYGGRPLGDPPVSTPIGRG